MTEKNDALDEKVDADADRQQTSDPQIRKPVGRLDDKKEESKDSRARRTRG